MAIHQLQVHPEYVEGCFMCKVSSVQLSTGDANTQLSMPVSAVNKELGLYREARKQGIQPKTTKTEDIRKAIDISNKTGYAYGSEIK